MIAFALTVYASVTGGMAASIACDRELRRSRSLWAFLFLWPVIVPAWALRSWVKV